MIQQITFYAVAGFFNVRFKIVEVFVIKQRNGTVISDIYEKTKDIDFSTPLVSTLMKQNLFHITLTYSGSPAASHHQLDTVLPYKTNLPVTCIELSSIFPSDPIMGE